MTALTAVRPRPVFCVNEHEHRDRALAEAVAQGRFTFAGETLVLGTEPDWLHADLPADEEWRIDWVKFYYGLDLADAFRTTGEARFLEAWEQLVASFVLQVPPDFDDSEVTARRILNWIYAWQRLPEVSDCVAAALEESLGEQVRFVRENLSPERNHRTLELYALLIAALALPRLEPGLLEFAVAELHRNLLTDFGADGVHRERSTHYHLIALRSFVGARENCRRFGVALPAGFDERLALACEFARDCRRPDGTIPALSDSDTGDHDELLALAGRLLARDDLLDSRSADFPDGGYFVQRARDRYLVFDCGPLGDGGHGHWFRGTAAHNTVTVDGTDQTPYARGRSSLPSAEATFLGREGAGGLDVLCGEVRSPVYEAVHRRRVILVGGEYWIVEDTLRGERAHRYDLRWHLPPEADGLTRELAGGGVVAAGLAIAILGARSVALEDGWISPAYGVREPAPVVSAVATGTHATFVTLLAPREPGAPAPSLIRDGDTLHIGDDRIVLGERVTWRRGA